MSLKYTDPYCGKPDPEGAGYECNEWKGHTGPHESLIGWPMAPVLCLHWFRGQVWQTRGGVEIEGSRHRAAQESA